MKQGYLFTDIEDTYKGLRILRNHRLLKDFSDFAGISYGRIWDVSNNSVEALTNMSIKNFTHLMEKLEEYFDLNSISVNEEA